MSAPIVVVLGITRLEAAHLTGLITQFRQLLDETAEAGGPSTDPAVARLVPAAYADDDAAADDFRRVTESDLLARRAADAATVQQGLAVEGRTLQPSSLGGDPDAELSIPLDAEQARSWLRTLAALRLVLASRLGIAHEDDHDDGDPRYGIYDWVGYRLDGLVRALDER